MSFQRPIKAKSYSFLKNMLDQGHTINVFRVLYCAIPAKSSLCFSPQVTNHVQKQLKDQ